MAPPVQSILEQRRDQIFPKLDPLDIERVRRFGDVRSFAAGERLMTAGQVSPGLVALSSPAGSPLPSTVNSVQLCILPRSAGSKTVRV